MIKRLRYYTNYRENTIPYRNLAIEEALLERVEPGECILYLWQNRHTVVIGRNQNAWQECKVNALEQDGGFLVRRLSGGGAVYHDLGNLNFTFFARKEDYDVQRQLSVILDAVQAFGLQAVKSGRNDLEIDGQKFSGNAFYDSKGHCYHHGTILVQVDLARMSEFLQVSKAKLASKGVQSVRSRVVNLAQLAPQIDIDSLSSQLIQSFQRVYGLPAEELLPQELAQEELARREAFFASANWRFGAKLEFTSLLEQRYPWGSLQMGFVVKNGMVQKAVVYSDGLEADFLSCLPDYFVGASYEPAALSERLLHVPVDSEAQSELIQSALDLLRTQLE